MLLNIILIKIAGLAVLAILSYQDLKTMSVDTRLNYLMFGMLTGFALQVNYAFILFVLTVMGIVYIYFNLMRRISEFGEADPEVMAWAIIAVFLDSAKMQAMIFAVSFAALLIFSLVKYRNKKIPLVPVLALSYLISFFAYLIKVL